MLNKHHQKFGNIKRKYFVFKYNQSITVIICNEQAFFKKIVLAFNTGKNKFLPKFVDILGKLWKAEFSLNTTNIVIFYFQEYSNIGNI